MKDSYSFDRDEDGLDESFRAHEAAYHRIFQRCGLEYRAVQAESGMMGGSESVDFLAPSGSGENTLVTCENGDFAADLEVARAVPRPPEFPPPSRRPRRSRRPGSSTCEDLAAFLGIDVAATSKAMPMTKDDGTVVLALVRGDDRLEPAKLVAALGEAVRPATEDEIRAAFGAEPGSLGPVGFEGEVRRRRDAPRGPVRRRCEPHRLAPPRRRARPRLRGVASPTFASRSRATAASTTAARSASRRRSRSGTSSSSAPSTRCRSRRRFLDEDGKEKPLVMGSYGIGPGRVMAAAVEQRHDEAGHLLADWRSPRTMCTWLSCRASRSRPRRPRRSSIAPGLDVLLDDRDLRAGEKFADADLIGIPFRVTVGKKTLEDGMVDVRDACDRRRQTCRDNRVEQGGTGWQGGVGSARSRSARRSSG